MFVKKILLAGILICQAMTTLLAQQVELILPFGHAMQVVTAAYSKDGSLIATAAEDNDIILWNTRSGRSFRLLRKHVNRPTSLDFSSDGKYLASGAVGNQLIVWNTVTGSADYMYEGAGSVISKVLFSPDNKLLFIGCTNGSALLLSMEDSTVRELYRSSISTSNDAADLLGNSSIRAAEFSDDSKYIFSHSGAGNLNVYNSITGKISYSCLTEDIDILFSNGQEMAHFIPGSDRLVVFSSKEKMIVDPEKGDTLLKLDNSISDRFLNFGISPSGDSLIAFHQYGRMFKWDLKSGKLTPSTKLNLTPGMIFIYQSKLNLKGQTLITASTDSSLSVWNINTGQRTAVVKAGTIMGLELDPVRPSFLVIELKKDPITRNMPDGASQVSFSPKTTFLNNVVVDIRDRHIISISRDKLIRFWDLDRGGIIRTIPGPDKEDANLKLSTGDNFFCSWYSNQVLVYKAEDGALLYTLGNKKVFDLAKKTFDLISGVEMSEDEKYICASSSDHTVRIWRLSNGAPVYTLNLRSNEWGFSKSVFTADSKYVLGLTALGKLIIWDMQGGHVRDTFSTKPLTNLIFTGKSHNLFCAQDTSGRLFIYDIDKKKMVSRIKLPDPKDFRSAVFSENDSLIVTTGTNDCSVWKVSSGQPVTSVSTQFSVIDTKINLEQKTLLCTTSDGTLFLADLATGEEKGSFKFADNVNVDLNDLYDNKLLGTGSQSFYLYNMQNEKMIELTPIGRSDYIVRTDSNYYLSTTEAAKLVSWKKDSTVFSFAQFDIRFNRPDKVLEALSVSDSGLISSYLKAYYHRIKKLKIDTTSFTEGFSLPVAEISNRAKIDYEQKAETILLKINAIDSINNIDRFNIWVNDVPVFGMNGLDLRSRELHYFDSTFSIKLSSGDNTIETSITNVNGIESYRTPLLVNYAPAVKQSVTTHFIGIGIDKFRDSKNDLRYSSKDIRDLSVKLKEKYGSSVTIDTLFNENVTVTNVKALKQKLWHTSVNDRVIISYSGHGLLSKDFDYYLSTYDINFEKPEEGGLAYDELENLLDSIPARKKLMLIDACHSGEVDKEELVRINTASDSLHLTKGGITVAYAGEGKLGMKNSFELMQNLFVNVGKSTGATIISAAAGTQFALERGDLKNGVFTYCILEAMDKNKTMKVSELKKIVGQRVEELTNGLQKPTSRNENISVDWEIW